MHTVHLGDGYWREQGCYLHLWTSGANVVGKYTYIWADWKSDSDAPLDYRIVQNAIEVIPWSRFADVETVFAKTKFVEEEDSGYDAPPPLGGAERLAAGKYQVEVRAQLGEQQFVFTGPEFEVKREDQLL